MSKSSPLVSVIVPIYNIEQFLKPCVDSILAQTYDNYEVYLVDDGSTDNSGQLAEEYAKADERITVFHKPNGGLSDARNYGIERAHGEYLTFIDSDDFIGEDYLKILVELVTENDADISVIKSMEVPEDGAYTKPAFTDKRACGTAEEAIKKMCVRDGFGTSAWGKLYKADLYANRKFPKGKLYEDLLTVPYVFAEAKKVAYSDSIQHYWRQRNNSIMHRPIREVDLEVFDGLIAISNYIDDHYPAIHDAGVGRFVADFFGTIVNRLVYDKEYVAKANQLKTKYRLYLTQAADNKFLSRKAKLKTKAFLINVRLYKMIYLTLLK